MGLCGDKSTTFLKSLGYNVVRHPSAALRPLDLIGVQRESLYLGPLNLLLSNSPGGLPKLQTDVPAADINGQSSSKLDVGIGASILAGLIAALGKGTLGAASSYTDAQTLEFSYSDVMNDQVVPLEVGSYLRNGSVDQENKILAEYVLGNGTLYLVTKVAKSRKFTVTYERKNGTAAKVDVPTLQGAVGGSVTVTTDGMRRNVVSYEGAAPLTFAFQCFAVGVEDGTLNLTAVRAGGVVAAATGGAVDQPQLLAGHGLLALQGLPA
jgi:hypothetical protein